MKLTLWVNIFNNGVICQYLRLIVRIEAAIDLRGGNPLIYNLKHSLRVRDPILREHVKAVDSYAGSLAVIANFVVINSRFALICDDQCLIFESVS